MQGDANSTCKSQVSFLTHCVDELIMFYLAQQKQSGSLEALVAAFKSSAGKQTNAATSMPRQAPMTQSEAKSASLPLLCHPA